ncbi:MAG: NAD(+) synthetase [Candidatus Omnitrophica bacterium CG07_land_8_20_14_0_80_42_15]|uniref:NH(3)-dependent NAD(+) synthetase n=1 Tax=Candidatus Aquitaenariimonas noxiae TaxID=1974741 RepID=A0A2J0KUW2_9BACT|nr:MAG: NAD(+) synthetase [Candidatus Omnitrophica bacterium CG07_land_8_20_14_0_80_42_15]
MTEKGLAINAAYVEKKLTGFIKREFKKKNFKKAVFGLSGGVDSSLVAFLLVKALGSKNVTALFMPYRTTAQESKRDFDAIVKILKIKHKIIPITSMVDCYFKKFPEADKVRRGNKMARERMSILYDQSKVENALVIGSGNKTEILLGYATLFGDTACAINPIGSLYKTQIRQLARCIGMPERIIKKPPTADLWPGQTDESEIGITYEEVDKILYLAVDKKYKLPRLVKLGFGKDSIDKILKRVDKFKYKRELPVIGKID